MIYWLPSVLVPLTIIGPSHQSDVPLVTEVTPDYIWHFAAYFVFGLTLVFGQTQKFRAPLSKKAILGLWLGALLFAISDEVHQYFVVSRSAEGSDLLADSLGALTAIMGSRVFGIKRCRRFK